MILKFPKAPRLTKVDVSKFTLKEPMIQNLIGQGYRFKIHGNRVLLVR